MCKSHHTDDKLFLIVIGLVRSCNPLKFLTPIISLEPLSLRSSYFYAYINSSNRMTYHPQNGRGYGHVTVLKFCCLPRCSASRGFVSDS